MKFYSGFCFQNEESLFEAYVKQTDFCVAGFSLGAIKACEYALNATERIDTLQLFSPAFFIPMPEKMKRMQLMFYKKDAKAYFDTFFKNCLYPCKEALVLESHLGSLEELELLLHYQWECLEKLVSRGIAIEVYLGLEDKIIDAQAAHEFFKEHATVYSIKNAGHFLKG